MEVALVWWLMAVDYQQTTVIVPVPYTSEEMCHKAAEYAHEANCIPQPASDVALFGHTFRGDRNVGGYQEVE
jgi:hypothetical protein